MFWKEVKKLLTKKVEKDIDPIYSLIFTFPPSLLTMRYSRSLCSSPSLSISVLVLWSLMSDILLNLWYVVKRFFIELLLSLIYQSLRTFIMTIYFSSMFFFTIWCSRFGAWTQRVVTKHIICLKIKPFELLQNLL